MALRTYPAFGRYLAERTNRQYQNAPVQNYVNITTKSLTGPPPVVGTLTKCSASAALGRFRVGQNRCRFRNARFRNDRERTLEYLEN